MFGSGAQTVICSRKRANAGAVPEHLELIGAAPAPEEAQHVGGGPPGGDVTLGVLRGHHEVVAVAHDQPLPLGVGAVQVHRHAVERGHPSGQAGQEHGEELVDAVDRQLGVGRRRRLARRELGVDPVDAGLLGAPPVPEAAVRSAGEKVHTEAPGSVAARASCSARAPSRKYRDQTGAGRGVGRQLGGGVLAAAALDDRPRPPVAARAMTRGGPPPSSPDTTGPAPRAPPRRRRRRARRSRARGAAGTARSPCPGGYDSEERVGRDGLHELGVVVVGRVDA